MAATAENINAAQKIRNEYLARAQRGEVVRESRVSLHDAITDFTAWYQGEHPNGNGKWAASLMASFEVFFSVNRPRLVSQLIPADLEAFKTWRRNEHQIHSNTLRKQLILLRQFFGYARKHGWMSRDPLADVKIPAEQGSDVMHVLSPAEESEYFEAASELSRDLYDVGRLMLGQGCRPDELMSLEQVNVDLSQRRFTVWNSTAEGKTENAHRTLHMTEESYKILTRRLFLPGKWVFPSPKNDGPRTTLQKKHEAAVALSGVRCRLYDMRHTFATRFALREGGAGSLPALAKILGHADLSLLMRYVHPSQEDMDRAMQHFDRAQKKARKQARSNERKEQAHAILQ